MTISPGDGGTVTEAVSHWPDTIPLPALSSTFRAFTVYVVPFIICPEVLTKTVLASGKSEMKLKSIDDAGFEAVTW